MAQHAAIDASYPGTTEAASKAREVAEAKQREAEVHALRQRLADLEALCNPGGEG
jgi:hypothetical protein